MRRSSVYMLLVATVLGLAAVLIAKVFLVPSAGHTAKAVETRAVVVAASPIAFGEKLVAAKLKIVALPAASIAAGTFSTIAEALASGEHVALRAVVTNEPITIRALVGQTGRLSASELLRPNMRAVAIPVSEAGSAAGLLTPGDMVDVYYTSNVKDDEAPVATILIQNARVLAMGQNSDVASDLVAVVHTATIEVSPQQAIKIVLAQSTGVLSLSLRKMLDDAHVGLTAVRIADLNDGSTPLATRTAARGRRAGSRRPAPTATVEIERAMKPTTYTLPVAR